MQATQLVWLRNDLRLDDHPALALAAEKGPIQVVFCATPKQWQQHNESPAKLGLRAAAIQDIADRLAQLGIPFYLLEVDSFTDVPDELLKFCQQQNISDIWFQAETPLDEQRRDQAVNTALTKANIIVHLLAEDLLVALPVKTQQDDPFKVFTPYYRRWLQILEDIQQAPYAEPKSQGKALKPDLLACDWAGEFRDDLWPGNEQKALERLSAFCEIKLDDYKSQRDFPSKPATSTLSPYLANGQLGPRRLLDTIQFYCGEANRDWRHDDWLRELAWRDFYKQLLLYFPRLSMGKAFKPETEKVIWRNDEAGFKAWCEGKTGFPIVDAAMRQLNQTGWMHNRLRMITASFLSKLLLLDWRRGEQYFLQTLIDGEFAANNGGWQWSASTGVDAAPYFRVFNPTLQSERYDPQGLFIKRFVPELKDVPIKQLHNPPAELREQCGYPQPVVDYKQARKDAIAAFKDLPKD
ncbi:MULTISPECIES: cryptochrome/photolyase family protein [unclassified Methylophaga]|uniref:cryptochrome/photolyase family protein n=1 Tax=unclassified Methylophaga TaxID=2629249 RepID=UPI000C9659EF|nr:MULTISPECIES: FAD-binding domain-containing protein [unclassified Methylophaga]MBN46845.1 deoxyribodipyrimidine photolyase [Methylophaga sp.]|tara:strand:+ start:152751 stop:154148 length:1398 start_codon:yes stop_codon:yes gene_type:complete